MTIVGDTTEPAARHEATGPRVGAAVRIAAVCLLFLAAWIAVTFIRQRLLAADLPVDAVHVIRALLSVVFGVTIVVVACRTLDRRRLASLGFSFRRADGRAFALGGAFWLGLAAVALVVGVATNSFAVAYTSPTWAYLGWFLLQAGLVLAYEAIPEELVFRGYVFTNLAERTPVWIAVMGQAVLFTVWAFALVGLIQLVGLGTDWSISLDRTILFLTFGITLALLRLWWGSLWAAIGFHLAFQTVAQLVAWGRMAVLGIPRGPDLETAYFFWWFFTIVIGGLIALVLLIRKKRRMERNDATA